MGTRSFNMKICNRCKEEKGETEYHSNGDKTYSICKDCKKETRCKNYTNETKLRKIREATNKDNILEQKRKYRKTEKYREYQRKRYTSVQVYNREYYIKNKKRLNEQKRIIANKRYNEDEVYRFNSRIRNLIYLSFTKNGYKKQSKTHEILGCTFIEFKLHVESQWLPWMNWDNYGLYNGELNHGWDIDHIVPSSSALTEEDAIELNHYTNLQPLCSKTNRDIKKDSY